jgi:hypothetical protein
MDDALVTSGLLAAFVLFPFALGAALPHALRPIILLGALAAVVEWLVAYRTNLASGQGDWQAGLGLAVFTGAFAVLVWFPLWLCAAVLGRKAGTWISRRAPF